MIDKLESLIKKYNDLSNSLSDSTIIAQPKKYAKLAKEHKSLSLIVDKAEIYMKKHQQLIDDEEILNSNDDDMIQLAKEEIPFLRKIWKL